MYLPEVTNNTYISTFVQERIELAKPAREHATTHVHIDGEIQTWRSYSKNSSIRIWIFMTQQQEKVTEKATKWNKMKRCVGIHSSEMTSSLKPVSPSTAIPTLSDCYKGTSVVVLWACVSCITIQRSP